MRKHTCNALITLGNTSNSREHTDPVQNQPSPAQPSSLLSPRSAHCSHGAPLKSRDTQIKMAFDKFWGRIYQLMLILCRPAVQPSLASLT